MGVGLNESTYIKANKTGVSHQGPDLRSLSRPLHDLYVRGSGGDGEEMFMCSNHEGTLWVEIS